MNDIGGRRETKIMAAGGCGVSVLLWSDGEEGTLNEHPSSRCPVDKRYRRAQCGQHKLCGALKRYPRN